MSDAKPTLETFQVLERGTRDLLNVAEREEQPVAIAWLDVALTALSRAKVLMPASAPIQAPLTAPEPDEQGFAPTPGPGLVTALSHQGERETAIIVAESPEGYAERLRVDHPSWSEDQIQRQVRDVYDVDARQR
jgi:hypothetical protein